MRLPVVRFFAWFLVLVVGAGPSSGRPAPLQAPDAVALLGAWVERFAAPREPIEGTDLAILETLVADVRMTQVVAPERRREACATLLDLAAFAPLPSERAQWQPSVAVSPRERASRIAFEALDAALFVDGGEHVVPWLATTILAQPRLHPAARRRAALELLRMHREPAALLAVLGSAIDASRDVRDAAMAALEGWNDDGVHRFMLAQLDKSQRERGWITEAVVLRHFTSLHLAAASPISGLVRAHAWRNLSSPAWKPAVTGVRLLATLDDPVAVPVLIEGLSLWVGRRTLGAGSRRIEDEIARDLKRRSGRNLGPRPERWSTWWKAVQAGTTPANLDDDPQATRSEFFGLRPWTDRVVLVIDDSGSMNGRFANSGGTRFDAALQQMTGFLRQLGPQARFRVVLFESELHVWKETLQPATATNLEAAQRWAAYAAPAGGTELRAAIEHVFRIDRRGTAQLERIEEDTVIVLCDGETAEGPNWVRPLLERVNQDACLVFHCVQLGSAGDGTLQRLAELSGGEFVQVEP